MASKEGAIVLIPLMLLFDLAFRAERLPQWKTPAAFYPAAAAGLAIELYLRHIVRVKARAPEHPFLDNPLFGAGFLEGRLTACGVLLRYLKLLLWPSTLSADYSYNQIPLVSMGAGLAALAARTVRRGRGKRTAYIGARRPALRGRVSGPALLARSLTYGSG